MAGEPPLWTALRRAAKPRLRLREFRAALGAEGASILLLADDEMRFCISEGLNAEELQGSGPFMAAAAIPLSASRGINSIAALMGKSLCVQQMDDRHNSDVDERFGQQTRSMMAVPLVVAEAVIGTLSVINPHASDVGAQRFRFTQDDMAEAERTAAELSHWMEKLSAEGGAR